MAEGKTGLRKWISAAVAVSTFTAGIGIAAFWVLSEGRSTPQSYMRIGNGVTFADAYGPVNSTLSRWSDGPWRPTSILGVASGAPSAPLPNYNASLNQTMRLCGELPGVTVWNDSGIPVYTGGLAAGAAPFWSILFRNTTGAYVYATDLEGIIRIDGPSSTVDACVEAAGIGSSLFVPSSVNSPQVSLTAYLASGKMFSAVHPRLVEYYVLGNAQLEEPDASPVGWVVNYFQCDVAGVSGRQNYAAVGVNESGNTQFIDNGWLTCTLPSYRFDFGSGPLNATGSFGTTVDVSLPFLVTAPDALANNTTLFDAWGLLTWVTRLQLAAGNSSPVSESPPSCNSWVPSLTECPADSSGWFVVLLSQGGVWLDSYPSATNDSSWSVPNVILSSQDQFVLVAPASWNLSADALEVTSTTPNTDIEGSVTL